MSPRARQQIEMPGMSKMYLFSCYLEWRNKRNVAAYQELVAALVDPECDIRVVAELLLHRDSPRPEITERSVDPGELAAEFPE